MPGVATEFQKIIENGRDRKKNEALASKIFSKDRRKSAPGKLKPSAGPSLASRVGVKKTSARTATTNRRASVPAGNVNGDWTHDLHHTVSKTGAGSLASRITPAGSKPKTANKQARLAAALDAMDVDQLSIQRAAPVAPSLTIKGLAGPFAVMGQNFAPGTTPADVESAMTPIGGEMVSCRLVKSQPFVLMEMVFASREGGERVIETFNDKTADGRIIKVYAKQGNAPASAPTGPKKVPTGPRAQQTQEPRNGGLISDGMSRGKGRGRGGRR